MTSQHNKGLSYAETLVAVAIMAIAILPGMRALQSGLNTSQQQLPLVQAQLHVTSRMDQLLALPFSALAAEAELVGSATIASDFSDPPGAQRRIVYVSYYDADNADGDDDVFTGGESDLVWLAVSLENSPILVTTLTTL